MNKPLFLVITGLLAVSAATSSLATAGEHHREGHAKQRWSQHQGDAHPAPSGHAAPWFDTGMQPVPTSAGLGQAGEGWRYYADPQAHRAVVISPQGDYFLGRGKGMRLVAVTGSGA